MDSLHRLGEAIPRDAFASSFYSTALLFAAVLESPPATEISVLRDPGKTGAFAPVAPAG